MRRDQEHAGGGPARTPVPHRSGVGAPPPSTVHAAERLPLPHEPLPGDRPAAVRHRRRASPRAIIVALLAALGLTVAVLWMLAPDDDDGTLQELRPGDSLTDAVSRAADGGRIVLHEGHYPPSVIAKAFTRPLTIAAAPGARPSVGGLLIARPAANVVIRDISLRPGPARDGIRFADHVHGVTVSGVDVAGGEFGIYFAADEPGGWPRDIRIEDSDISGSRTDAIRVSGARDLVIVGNRIHDTQINGMHNDGVQAVASRDMRIERNEFFFTRRGDGGPNQAIILGRADPPVPGRTVTGTRVIGNLVHHWRGTGLLLAGTSDTLIAHNTIWDGGRYGRDASLVLSDKRDPDRFANTDVRLVNNVLWELYVVPGAARPAQERNNLVMLGGGGSCLIGADPRFADRRDYRLTPESPAVDAGARGFPGARTLSGARRDERPDLGATELPGGPHRDGAAGATPC